MSAEVETMFYAGAVPWHGLGVGVAEAKTSEEAIVLAGLDWDVTSEPVFGANGMAIPGYQAMTRSTDARVLGIPRMRYQPIQNRQCFDFVDSLVSDDVMRYETAGSLFDGRVIWLLAQIRREWKIRDDVYKSHLLFSNQHDGEKSAGVWKTDVRVVCANTYSAATNRVAPLARIRHSGSIEDKLNQARKLVMVETEAQRNLERWLNAMALAPTTAEQVEQVQDKLFGPLDDATPTRRKNAIEKFQAIYESELEHCGENAYALVQAVTGYADHALSTRNPDTHFESVISGNAALLKAKGIAEIAKIAKVKLS